MITPRLPLAPRLAWILSAAEDCEVKIGCHCGAVIIDQTDDLLHKGHLIPDQEWFATYDAIDDELIALVADGRLGKTAAYHQAQQIISRSARLMRQCRVCGRLYRDGVDGQLRCSLSEGEQTDREVLRSRQRHGEPSTEAGG